MLKKISKSTWVIVGLVLLNVGVFFGVSNRVQTTVHDSHQMTTANDDNTYFKSGVDVLNWTYTLYKYFN